jgi:hypothetical protein
LKGYYQDVNNINISIDAGSALHRFSLGLYAPKNIQLSLKFFWTEEKVFFNIARAYLHDNHLNDGITHNSCYIFNSRTKMFGGGKLRSNFKKEIIANIGKPNNAGFRIEKKLDFGILSLDHLNNEVKQSMTITEATENLEKLFKNAIKQS